ncbi:hypothetical protein EJ03DRAFT_337240 [Teratosphaeria nubilosa]|uniref:F-box domain-containing protein n=1 Tax=Teratosphaeria nubilosa TaxID=161662 RepID=A0A6G1L5S5_9PEZI|nr:hypothetical protein EJ03DRAFT_337240 [Teratosphaeria nubilosa]
MYQIPEAVPRTAAPIFQLPLELRQEIYSYLVMPGPISHPLPGVGITSVSHKLPSSALLFINKQFTADILDYYYTITTWKLIFSHAFNFFRVDPCLDGLARSPALRHIQKVEVVFFCDILLLKEYPSFGMTRFCDEIRKRADRACEVLSQSERLRSVTVSWIDTTMTGDWSEKATTLQPLRRLAKSTDLTFRIGDVAGPEDVTPAVFSEAMQEVLGDFGRGDSDVSVKGTTAAPAGAQVSEKLVACFTLQCLGSEGSQRRSGTRDSGLITVFMSLPNLNMRWALSLRNHRSQSIAVQRDIKWERNGRMLMDVASGKRQSKSYSSPTPMR